jgi:hypothetical protein
VADPSKPSTPEATLKRLDEILERRTRLLRAGKPSGLETRSEPSPNSATADAAPPSLNAAPASLAGGGDPPSWGLTVRGGHREISGYPVTDDDLTNLANDSEEDRSNLSLASAAGSLFVAIFLDGWVWGGEVNAVGEVIRTAGLPVFGVLCVFYFLRHRHYRRQYKTRVQRIKDGTNRGKNAL